MSRAAWILVRVSALGLFATLGHPPASWAQTVPVPPDLGMLGLSRGETVRLSAVLVGNPDLYPPGPCRVTFGFVDGEGKALQDRAGSPITRDASLRPGRAASLDLPATEAF